MKRSLAFITGILFTCFVFAYEYRAGTNGSIERAAWQTADNDSETYWSLQEGQTDGWLEIVSEIAEKKDAVYIECELPENSKIQLYEENGNGQTSLSGCFKYGPFDGILKMTLPEMRRESNVLGIKLSGENACQIKIKEVSFDLRYEEEIGKIIPASYEFNLKEQINLKPERLWDSKITGPWYEPLWYLPYEIQSDQKVNRTDEIFGNVIGEPREKAQIIWNLDGVYEISVVRTYIQRAFRSIKVEYEDDNNWKTLVQIGPYNQKDETWVEEEVYGITTKRLRITFPGGWEQARFISELEIMGTRLQCAEEGLKGWKEIYGTVDGNVTHFIAQTAYKDLELELSICKNEKHPALYINETKIEPETILALNDNNIIHYFIKKELLRDGEQFIRIESSEVESCLIRENRNNKTSDEKVCDIELYRPTLKDTEWKGCIIGWSGDSLDNVKINGYGLQRSDRLFYLPLSQMDFYRIKGKLEVTAENQGKKYKEIFFIKGGQKQKGGVLNCKEDLEYIIADTFVISGKAERNYYKAYINGKEVSVDRNGKFSAETALTGGYQRIEIELKDNTETVAFWTKEIYKMTDTIKLYVSGADKGIITQEDDYEIRGRIWNAVNPELKINGEVVGIKDGVFTYKCILEEGENVYKVSVKDRLGRTAEKEIIIEKDTTAPKFEIKLPENEVYWPESVIKFEIESDEKDLWYEVADYAREYCAEKVYTKEYELKDDFYSWTVYAYDRAGNKSEGKSVGFCIDTTLPEEFDVIPDTASDIENWRNTNNVTVSFETTDATSGVDRYEYILDSGDWEICESPLNLGELEDGIHNVFVRAVDKAGNIRLETLGIYVDVTRPEDFTFTADINKEEWTSQNSITLYFGTNDANSGIRKYTLSIDGGVEIDFVSDENTPVMSDGKHILTVSAYDRAGNVTRTNSEYFIDVTPPKTFVSEFDIEFWSNNNRPTAVFATEDETSGVNRYELKLDDNDWKVIESPYQFETLADGIHNALIRAIDQAGNITETEAYSLHIDTTPPLAVDNCRLIPGNGNMEGRWSTKDSDVIAYHIRWIVDDNEKYVRIDGKNVWENGIFKEIILPETSYAEELTNGKIVKMIVQAEDKAHNYGPEQETTIAMTGVSIVALKEDEPTAIEYKNITMAVPAVGQDSKIKGVMIKEIDAPILHENSTNPILSPIYSFTTLAEDGNGNLVEQEHTHFDEEVVFFLRYDEDIVPNGFPESDLEVYYYDDLWGRWFRAEKSGIDIEQNLIIVATNHFTNYSIQPTLLNDLTPEELKKSGHAYGNTESTTGDVVISPESGTMMTEATEFVIHGKNGFEFPIKRMYDTQTARLDGPSLRTQLTLAFNFNVAIGKNILSQLKGYGAGLALSTVEQCLQNYFIRNGDYNLAMGAGWRLNLPYVMADNNNVMVRLPNGSYYSTNQMEMKDSDNTFGLYHNLVMENHIGDDFTFTVKMRKSLNVDFETSLIAGDSITAGKAVADILSATTSSHSVQGWVDTARSMMGWIIEEATLTMKDGTQYVFGTLGGIQEIRDSSGENIIRFKYAGRLIDSIIDPYGNEIKIHYNLDSFIRPYITSIEKADSDGNIARWSYEYDTEVIESFFGILPQMTKAIDAENRETKYVCEKSESNILLTGGGSAKLNIVLAILDIFPPISAVKEILGAYSVTLTARFGIEWPQFISEIQTPEKGTVKINYDVIDLSNFEIKPADYFLGMIPTAIKFSYDFYQKLFTSSVVQFNGSLSKTTTYNYNAVGYGSQHLVTRCVINDGNTVTTNNYTVQKKTYYKYTCVDDNVLDIISKATLMTEESNWEKSYYTRLASTTIEKAGEGFYETKTYSWDNDHSRILSETSERSAVKSEVSYSYDNWGNITKQTEKLSHKDVGGETRIKTTFNQYYGTNSGNITGFPYTGIPASSANRVRNLLIAQSVNDGYQTVYTANAYDSYGRNIWSGIYNKDHWAVTSTEYAGGEISKQINPLGQETDFDYEYTDSQIIKTATYKGKRITTKSAESKFTRAKLWEIDGNGNKTQYSYDKIGRVTKIKYPGTKEFSGVLKEKTDSVSYDDKLRTVTVSHEDGKIYEKYYYDSLHNLIKQELYDYSSDSPAISARSLKYDINNNVIKMIDANSNETSYEYDKLNRLVKQTNPDRTTKITEYYDNFAQRTIKDENENITTEKLSYDGLVESQTKQNTSGMQNISYAYDANGRVVEKKEQLDLNTYQVTTTKYSVFGEVSKITKPVVEVYEGGVKKNVTPVEVIEYNDIGLAAVKKNGYEGNFHVEETLYDTLGRAESVKNYALKDGQVASEVRTVSYTYDANGNVLTETDAEGNVKTYTYTARNQKQTEKDPLDGLITYFYDRNDKVIKQITKQTDEISFVAEYKYDDLGRLVQAILPEVSEGKDKRVVSITYDKNGNAIKMTEPGRKCTEWTYDSRNRKKTEIIKKSGTDETISEENCQSIERSWTYDDVGNILTLTEGTLVTYYTYDCLNNLLETRFPDGQEEIRKYDLLNRVIEIQNVNREQGSKKFIYNSLNLITYQKDEDDNNTYFKYDVWGNQTERNEKNSEGSGDQIWNITYNAFGQPVFEEKNDGTKWSYEYNARGLLTKKTDPKGIVLTNEYDACGRLLSETRKFGGKSETKTYTYDKNGFMYAASDNGVVSKINFVGGKYKANAYDLVTSFETTVSGKKFNTSYSYDDALNLSELSYPDGSKVDYSYNALSQLTAISNGSINYAENGTYDSLGRLLSLTAGNGKVTSRTWDGSAGTLSDYSWGLDKYVTRQLEWDKLGNIKSIVKGASDKSYKNTYEYDRLGRLLTEHNGAEAEVTTKESQKDKFLYVQNDVSGKNKGVHNSEVVKLDYYAGSVIVDLDAVQTLSSLKVFAKNNRIKPEHLEVWLSEDNDIWIHDKDVTWENSRDGWKVVFGENAQAKYVKLHSLWDERDEDYLPEDHSTFSGNLWNLFEVSYIADGKENTYKYDARGNRLKEREMYGKSQTGVETEYEYYANSDLIKRAGSWYFNYDKNGNLLARGTKVQPSGNEIFVAWTFSETDGELWTYEYDLQNRMTKANYSGKGSSNLKERGSYVYDYRGLLVKKTYQNYNPSDLVEVENEEASKTVTEFYEYTADGRVIYNESTEENTTKKTTYIWANTTLWCEVNEGVVYYHHTDHLGTTEVVTDSNGTVVWEAGYEAFGSVLSERGDSVFTPNYTGKFFDKASGLYYFNARWYDSELGKFTTSDPIRDGINWWNYCNGNPISFVDWMGLETDEILKLNNTVSYTEKINAEFRVQSNSDLLTKFQLENVKISVSINQNEYKIESLKGEIQELEFNYELQKIENRLSTFQVFGPAFSEAMNYFPNPELMGMAFVLNLDPQSVSEYVYDMSNSSGITQQDIRVLKRKNNKEIRNLKSINKGLNAEYTENQKQINLIKQSIQEDMHIVNKWRIENEQN